ncbi:hypothetical protein Tco_1286416, partial [Tanacetum coccineum]
MDEIKARFVNTLCGCPVGKRLAFPMFDSKTGMEKVMEGGPWRIQLVPFILKVWLPNTLLKKDKVTHTNFICLNSWGRSDYARVLVEVSADKPLVELVDIDIPCEDGKGYITANVRIEFEWQPPTC